MTTAPRLMSPKSGATSATVIVVLPWNKIINNTTPQCLPPKRRTDGHGDFAKNNEIMTKVMKAAVPAPKKEGVRRKGEASNGDAKSSTEKGLI